jgi:hypothetical protein
MFFASETWIVPEHFWLFGARARGVIVCGRQE